LGPRGRRVLAAEGEPAGREPPGERVACLIVG